MLHTQIHTRNQPHNTKHLDKGRELANIKYRTLKRDILEVTDFLDESTGVSLTEKNTHTHTHTRLIMYATIRRQLFS